MNIPIPKSNQGVEPIRGAESGHNRLPLDAEPLLTPEFIQSLANQMYQSTPESLILPSSPTGNSVPTDFPMRPSAPSGSSPVNSGSPLSPSDEEGLTAIARSLYDQMQSADLDPRLGKALKQLGSPERSSNLAQPTHSESKATAQGTTSPLYPAANQPSFYFLQDPSSASQLSPTVVDTRGLTEAAVSRTTLPNLDLPNLELTRQAQFTEFPQTDLSSATQAPEVQNLRSPGRASSSRNGTAGDSGIFEVEVIRRDFPILHQQVNGRPLIWFDNAATTQKPYAVIDSLSRFYERDNSNIHRAAHTLAARATDSYESAREKVQRFLGAGDASEIVFVRGTTEAINLVTQSYGRKFLRAGDEIILSTLEHHANIVPWQMLAQETGAVLKVIPINDRGEILMDEYSRLLGPRTRFVAVTQVSNSLGTILPVAEITHLAHRHGAKVLIDGAQAVSHMPVDVQAIDCDFYVFSGHKLFAPSGIGVLYAKAELLEAMPPWQGGGSMIRHVTFEETVYSDPPAKFEAGTPNIADAVGLGAAIDYITRLGLSNIERYEHNLTDYATEQLSHIPGLRLIGTAAHKVSVVSFVLDGIPTEQVGQRLAQEGIAVRAGHHCAQPSLRHFGLTMSVRPSLAFYNTQGEVDRLVEVIKTLRYR
ncbi:MAG: family 2A encapsulin nanocompartment cargo protein cysteine desulfurase [Cyanobacteria bacterium]|nr:family 2A encapsulin nanocompartment cargo protein cysteine desulfurase [Cyanobacteriota bacterium]